MTTSDCCLLATSTPDHLLPPSAPLVAHKLGLANAGGIDMAGACAGFIYALTLADSYVRSHGTPVLVIAANILSRRINPAERASSVLFADAAGAVLLAPSAARRRLEFAARISRPRAQHYDLITIPGGGSRKPFAKGSGPERNTDGHVDGQAVYAKAVAMMTGSAAKALEKAGVTASDVDHFIPHQANARMMTTFAQQLEIPPERLRSTIESFGNSSAATIPFTLSASAEEHAYKTGDVVLMTAAGAGLTGGAAVFRW